MMLIKAVPIIVKGFLEGFGTAASPSISGSIGSVGTQLVDVAVEGLNTQIEVVKNENRNVDAYVNLLQDGFTVREAMDIARQTGGYVPGRNDDALRSLIVREAQRQGIPTQ